MIGCVHSPAVYTTTTGGATVASWSAMGTQPSGAGGAVACYSPTSFVVGASGGGLNQWNGSSWTAVSTVPNGSWGGSFSPGRTLTVDWVDGTYIAWAGTTIYKWTNPASVSTYSFVSGNGLGYTGAMLKSVPGKQGHVFASTGFAAWGSTETLAVFISQSAIPATIDYPTNVFYFSSNHGQTFTALPNVGQVGAFCFTAPASGQTYPTIRFWGWVKIASVWTYGLYRIDGFNPSNISATTVTAENIQYPKSWFGLPAGMGGDMGQWGRSITAVGGGGFSIEQINGQTNAWP